jgi:hypothetical protein
VFGGDSPFAGCASGLDLAQVARDGRDNDVRRIDPAVVDAVVPIDDDGDHLMRLGAHLDVEVIVFVRGDSRRPDEWSERRRICRVVLHERQNALDRHARNEDRANPVMDEPVRDVNRRAMVAGLEPFDNDLAGREIRLGARALRSRLPIDPEKRRGARGLGRHPILGQAHIGVERRERWRSEFSGDNRRATTKDGRGQEAGPQRTHAS